MKNKHVFPVAILLFFVVSGCVKSNIPSPEGMTEAPRACSDPVTIFNFFEGIPYRIDGAINAEGNFTLFADHSARFDTPGLNCSGFVVAASRYFFNANLALDDMTIDRLGDSGNGAVRGQDWDFGYDLILNVTEKHKRKVMLPHGKTADINGNDGMSLRGFDLHDFAAWEDVISRMKPGRVYFFSMSKPVKFKNYTLLHSHVGLIVPDAQGHVWLCHATRKGGVNKTDIIELKNLERIVNANPDSDLGPRKILIIEACS